jgi:hypothetical protein
MPQRHRAAQVTTESPKIGRPFSKSNKTGRPLSHAERQRLYRERCAAHLREAERRAGLPPRSSRQGPAPFRHVTNGEILGTISARAEMSRAESRDAGTLSARDEMAGWTEETIDDAITQVRRLRDQMLARLDALLATPGLTAVEVQTVREWFPKSRKHFDATAKMTSRRNPLKVVK